MMAGSVVRVWVVRTPRVTDEAFVVLVFKVADDTEALWVVKAARRRCRQVTLSTNQQVPGRRVAAALFTRTWWSPISCSLT